MVTAAGAWGAAQNEETRNPKFYDFRIIGY